MNVADAGREKEGILYHYPIFTLPRAKIEKSLQFGANSFTEMAGGHEKTG